MCMRLSLAYNFLQVLKNAYSTDGDRIAKGKIWPGWFWITLLYSNWACWCPSAELNNILAKRSPLVHSYISPRYFCVVISAFWQPAAVTWPYYYGPFADAFWPSMPFSLAVRATQPIATNWCNWPRGFLTRHPDLGSLFLRYLSPNVFAQGPCLLRQCQNFG